MSDNLKQGGREVVYPRPVSPYCDTSKIAQIKQLARNLKTKPISKKRRSSSAPKKRTVISPLLSCSKTFKKTASVKSPQIRPLSPDRSPVLAGIKSPKLASPLLRSPMKPQRVRVRNPPPSKISIALGSPGSSVASLKSPVIMSPCDIGHSEFAASSNPSHEPGTPNSCNSSTTLDFSDILELQKEVTHLRRTSVSYQPHPSCLKDSSLVTNNPLKGIDLDITTPPDNMNNQQDVRIDEVSTIDKVPNSISNYRSPEVNNWNCSTKCAFM